MSKHIFKGAATAIITPFKDNSVDYDSFKRLIEMQIANNIDGIVVAGTTGENPTLTDDEQKDLIKFCVDTVNGRTKVIAGTATYDNAHSIELTRFACSVGVDGVLLVTPYYNKATQGGLVKHFNSIADASTKPCILYNVPSRTGCNILPETLKELSKHPNIAAVKEASGDISQVAKIAQMCGNDIDIYSGNDDQIVPILSLGGQGVISVLSNILPAETVEICHSFFSGDVEKAKQVQLDLLPLINQLFVEVNPIPVKAALAKMGYCKDELRLPLTSMSEKNKELLYSLMTIQGL